MDSFKGAQLADPDLNLPARALRHVVVLGANGTMGYGSGAVLSSAVDRVTFLARTRDKAQAGLEAAIKLVRSATVRSRVDVGSYDEDFEKAVSSADLIFEAVTEDLALKHRFFERIDAARRPDSIVATVTSGLSIASLAAPRSASFRRHFLGLHLFNPPNVIVGTELIAGPDTDPDIVDFVEDWCTQRIGRVMVRTADTPGFAGNRIGFKVLNEVARLTEEHGPALMDRLVGPYTGRALSPLATIDLVGWDIHRAIVDNLFENTDDEARASLELPEYMAKLLDRGTLGNKSGGGFFKRTDDDKFVLDPRTGDYAPLREVKLPKLGFIEEVATLHSIGLYDDAMRIFADAEGEYARLARNVIAGYIAYALHRVGEVTDLQSIDLIMGFGFNWAPPGLLVDTLGIERAIRMIEEADLEVPALLEAEAGRDQRLFTYPHVDPGRFFVGA